MNLLRYAAGADGGWASGGILKALRLDAAQHREEVDVESDDFQGIEGRGGGGGDDPESHPESESDFPSSLLSAVRSQQATVISSAL